MQQLFSTARRWMSTSLPNCTGEKALLRLGNSFRVSRLPNHTVHGGAITDGLYSSLCFASYSSLNSRVHTHTHTYLYITDAGLTLWSPWTVTVTKSITMWVLVGMVTWVLCNHHEHRRRLRTETEFSAGPFRRQSLIFDRLQTANLPLSTTWASHC
jgi:hypothetical protein